MLGVILYPAFFRNTPHGFDFGPERCQVVQCSQWCFLKITLITREKDLSSASKESLFPCQGYIWTGSKNNLQSPRKLLEMKRKLPKPLVTRCLPHTGRVTRCPLEKWCAYGEQRTAAVRTLKLATQEIVKADFKGHKSLFSCFIAYYLLTLVVSRTVVLNLSDPVTL